ncbi:MAG: DNA-binding response regulator [Candidatus Dactylopiibacterium carminicum]|uniref:DNA-binding response regulator n=1 Tax=Candidatus Dactylopiibacterium carminicum TaxID=857335 RepID=A0A272ENT0_9RHOO|nr:response regulator transcription factor [Candidatus Dactylopiibacterium carminicum]KAF7599540.1 DNA-binding response regulator [Candidatus Dactylopiibacterium carminicum]PAS91775.1 MAG: DNA-binding response regulator [Candidatus Dactylopiibacterium carminicum]PAS92664.1 MAG: DNA-binding response regulator [Candidatus Dactylopiibacterium carminicum]PAS99545.1 MAG: DNA-binding response regulator [Candidatus Dactylopiibacterium carminicum]
MISILLVDDHMIIRRGLRQILAEDARIGEISEAVDGPSALRLLRGQPIDVVLLDIALGERDGLDLLGGIRQEFPRVGVLMLSVYPESQFALRAIRSGAAGYLNKGCSPETLFAAICRAAEGATYVTPEIAELMAQDIRRDHGQAPHETLSNREFQVLQLLAQGQTVSDIARQLSLSANTISTYRARICDKLRLRNSLEIAHYAARHRLLQA